MKRIIRTSDLGRVNLQEAIRPKFRPVTSTALAKKKEAEAPAPAPSITPVLPQRKIAEKAVSTGTVETFSSKYQKMIDEERKKAQEADFTRAIEVKEAPKKKTTRKKRKEKEE